MFFFLFHSSLVTKIRPLQDATCKLRLDLGFQGFTFGLDIMSNGQNKVKKVSKRERTLFWKHFEIGDSHMYYHLLSDSTKTAIRTQLLKGKENMGETFIFNASDYRISLPSVWEGSSRSNLQQSIKDI